MNNISSIRPTLLLLQGGNEYSCCLGRVLFTVKISGYLPFPSIWKCVNNPKFIDWKILRMEVYFQLSRPPKNIWIKGLRKNTWMTTLSFRLIPHWTCNIYGKLWSTWYFPEKVVVGGGSGGSVRMTPQSYIHFFSFIPLYFIISLYSDNKASHNFQATNSEYIL